MNPTKSQLTSILMTVLQGKQYASEVPYQNFIEALQQVPQYPVDEAQELSRQLSTKFQELSMHVGEKFSKQSLKAENVIDLSISEVNQLRERMAEQTQEMQVLKDSNESLEENRVILQEKVALWEQEYETLKAQATQMQAKYERDLVQIKQEKKEVKRTFLQVQEDTEQDRKLLENLQIQKLEISEQILQQKRINKALLQELKELRESCHNSEKKISASATKIQYEERQIARLEEQLHQKNKLIEQLLHSQGPRTDSISINVTDAEHSSKGHRTEQMSPADSLIKRVSFVEKFKLGEEVHFSNEEYDEGYRRVNSVRSSMRSQTSREDQQEATGYKINVSVIEEEPEVSFATSRKSVFPRVPDLYYAHYLLTVQAVKLKMDKSYLLDIEMNEYYQNLIEDGEPFHNWDLWISKKLKSLGPYEQ